MPSKEPRQPPRDTTFLQQEIQHILDTWLVVMGTDRAYEYSERMWASLRVTDHLTQAIAKMKEWEEMGHRHPRRAG